MTRRAAGRRGALGAFGVAAVALASAAPAQVAVLPGTNEVLARQRPGYDAKGLPIGGLRLFPTIEIGLAVDDNIYNSNVLVIHDRLLTIVPQAALRSDWSRHSLAIDASARVERYDRTKIEDNEQYRLNAAGRFDITRTISVDGSAHVARAAEPRGSVGDVLVGGEAILYRTSGGTLGATIGVGRLTLRATTSLERYRYDDVQIGGTIVSQAYRDHDSVQFAGQAGILVSPNVTLYGTGSYNRQSYDRDVGFSFDAHGYTLRGGAGIEISRLLSARADIGYLKQSFADPRFGTIAGLSYSGALTWNPTPLLSVALSARKIVQQSPAVGLSGILTTGTTLGIDYELLRRLLVNARATYDVDAYHGQGRTDHRLGGQIGARYLLERHLAIGASYQRRHQRSDVAGGREYDGNAVMLTLRIQA